MSTATISRQGGLLLSPYRKKRKRKVGKVLYHREVENTVTTTTKGEGKFNVSKTEIEDTERSSKSYKSNKCLLNSGTVTVALASLQCPP